MTWQLSFKHYNVQMIRQPHWEMIIKHPTWKKHGLLLLILKLNMDIAVKENSDQKQHKKLRMPNPSYSLIWRSATEGLMHPWSEILCDYLPLWTSQRCCKI